MNSPRPSIVAIGSTADTRWASFLYRVRSVAGLQANGKDIPLSLLCLSFGPLIYAASAQTVTIMLLLAGVTLILSRPSGVPIIAKSIRALSAIAPLLAWMLLSATWSPDGEASVSLVLRLAALFSAGTLLVTSFDLLPLERLHRPLMALALGLSAAGATIAFDLALGGHLDRILHGPRPAGFDPALDYGRAAILHAILLVPISVSLLRLGAPRLAVGSALITATAVLETSSLSAKTALAVGLVSLTMVFILPQLRWAGLALLGLGAVTLPLMFPAPLSAEATCWLANHKPSALHRLEIWGFVADHIKQRPIGGWGLDAARRLPGGKAPVVIRHCDATDHPDGVALSSEILPLHPHNGILQIWLELGGIGIGLGFVPLILLIRHAFRTPAWHARWVQAMIAGSAAAAVAVGLVSFGIWTEWFISGLFFAAAFVVLAARLSTAAGEGTILPNAGGGRLG
jgi:O-antigen ligase